MGFTPDDIDAKAALARARAEADAIIGRAEVEAAAVQARAQAEADAVVARARVEATELRSQGEHAREHAQAVLDDAHRRADALLAEAEEVRRSADGTLERLIAARHELESTIGQLATSPNALVDLTETTPGGPEQLAHQHPPVTDALNSLDADALADPLMAPLGATSPSLEAVAPEGAEASPETEALGERGVDPVSRLVRAAVGRAARAATDAPGWSERPSEQREALRANGRDLG
jgi:hypothetical protein